MPTTPTLEASAPKRFFLDGNIYDKLAHDQPTVAMVRDLVGRRVVEVVASPAVVTELQQSPFRGLPTWFSVAVRPEGIAISGVSRSEMARASEGVVFKQHLGESRKGTDAIIAHSAHSMRAVLVSEDHRCRKRLKDITNADDAMTYDEFRAWVTSRLAQVNSA